MKVHKPAKEGHYLGEKHRFTGKSHGRDATKADVEEMLDRLTFGERPSDTRATSVYRLFDAEGNLLYVGITNRGHHRLNQHAADKDWWQDVASATIEHHLNRQAAMAAETKAIREENPRYNLQQKMTRQKYWSMPPEKRLSVDGFRRVHRTKADPRSFVGPSEAWEMLERQARRFFDGTTADVVRLYEAGELDGDERLPTVLGMLSAITVSVEEFGP